MRFEELFILFYENCGLDLAKQQCFLSLVNILINGNHDNDFQNPFKDMDINSTRFYHQYKRDAGYHTSKFKYALKKLVMGYVATYIDELNDSQKDAIDDAITNSLPFYRENWSEDKLTVGEGFERLLVQFIKQRTSKVDPGIPDFFPYESETQAAIAKVSALGNNNSYNLFILRPETISKYDDITLSRLNSPRVTLCIPRLELKTNEEWVSNLNKLKTPALFIETNPENYNGIWHHKEDRLNPACTYAYVGYVADDPLPINYEKVIVKYIKIGKVLLQDIVNNREELGITEFSLPNFYFGRSEGNPEHGYEDADGYWIPDETEILEASENGEELPPVKIDEFTMYPYACPMWTIKSVNLARALEAAKIDIELCR